MFCVSTLALAALGPWTYVGFLAEPAPPTPDLPAPKIELSRFEVIPGSTSSAKPKVALRQDSPRREKVTSTPKSTFVPPPPAVRYQMADQTGQSWEHTDPAILQNFVNARNREQTIALDRSQRFVQSGRRSSQVISRCR